MKAETIQKTIKLLDGLTYSEWCQIKAMIEYGFDLKRKECEKNLTLNANEIKNSIRSRFG